MSGGLAVCVFCSSNTHIDRSYLDLAVEVGAQLAVRGHALVSGGGSVSCMGAVAAAARAGGAHTTGVMPQALIDMEIGDLDSDELIITADMNTRKTEMERRADAFLVLPGGLGTLEELFEVWTGRVLGLHDKPIAILDPTGLYAPMRELLDGMNAQHFLRASAFDAVAWAGTPGEALDAIERTARPMTPAPDEIAEAEL